MLAMRTFLFPRRWAVLAATVGLLGPMVRAADPAQPFEWQRGLESLALLQGGKPVWQFNFGTNHATKPFFHPVALPGGAALTSQSPPDHRWHYGLWFSWKYLNRLNYWEQDRQGVSAGLTEWRTPRAELRPDHSARLEMDLVYRPHLAQDPVLTEKRTVVISRPAPDGSYAFDWKMVFTAGAAAVKLDRTPPARQGTEMIPGGYAGLSIRLTQDLRDAQVEATAEKGAKKNNRHGYAATASDFNGRLGTGEAGVAILDHPANPRAPTRWYAITDPAVPFWYLNAAWLQLEPFELPAGGSFTLRYRVIVHPDRWTPARLEAEQARYRRESP